MATYHAFHYGKMNQSFKLENENNQSLYEANLVEFKLLSACDYDFVNHSNSTTTTHKVGKTKTISHGALGVSLSTSYFTLDGKNCFDIMEEKGYYFKFVAKINILRPEFALVNQSGVPLATYKMNVPGPREEGVFAIGNKQTNIVITTESNDLETVFFGAFILSRVDFSLNTL